MEINATNTIQQNSSTATNTNLTGVAAPQTETQRADQAATRVTKADQSSDLENKASQADQRKFEAIKTVSSAYADGANALLKDIKYTVYKSLVHSDLSEYTIRFTDINTGKIEIKSEGDLFHGTEGGDLVSGKV